MKKTLKPINYNAGIRIAYKKKLLKLIIRMNKDIQSVIDKTYPIAQDASILGNIIDAINKVKRKYTKLFNVLADNNAKDFVDQILKASDRSLKKELKDAGFIVEFKLDESIREQIKAAIAENVNLIKSIPQQHFTEINNIVMQSFSCGRDMKQLKDELVKRYGITERRSAFIARDQINKVTSNLVAARQKKLGFKRGMWVHSGASKHPREKHVKANGKEFDLSKGLPVGAGGKWVMPGEEINCGCVWRPVIDSLFEDENET